MKSVQSASDFSQYKRTDRLGVMLLIREVNKTIRIIYFNPSFNGIDVTFNAPWIDKALYSLDRITVIDAKELHELVERCAFSVGIKCGSSHFKEALKTDLLCYHTEHSCRAQFLTTFLTMRVS